MGRLAAARLLEQAQQVLVDGRLSPAAIELVGLLRLRAETRAVAIEDTRELAVAGAA